MDGVFDGVCCFAALHLFADPSRALDRMTALLAPGRADRDLHQRARPVGARCARGSRWRAHAAACGCSNATRSRAGWSDGAFDDVRQLVTGVTQFVGGTLAG